MLIANRQSILDQQWYSMELDVTQEQLNLYLKRETPIQIVFPNLKREEREFIKTGILPDEWNRVFNNDEDDKFDEEYCYE